MGLKMKNFSLKSGRDLIVSRDAWLKNALSTKRIDRAAAKRSVAQLYKAKGLHEPIILFFESPAACLMAKSIIEKSINPSFFNSFRSQDELLDIYVKRTVRESGSYLIDSNRKRFKETIKSECTFLLGNIDKYYFKFLIWCYSSNQLKEQVLIGLDAHDLNKQNILNKLYNPLGELLSYDFKYHLSEQIPENIREHNFFPGWVDAYWISTFDYAQKKGVEYKDHNQLKAYLDFSKSCGITYLYEKIAFVSDRPEKVRLDGMGRLHCSDDYAMKFSDGFGYCVWHGFPVSSEWVIKKKLDAQSAISCSNEKERHAACEILGWNNILCEIENKVLDKTDGPLGGEIIEAKIFSDMKKQKFLRVNIGLPNECAYPIPIDIKRVRQAHSWVSFINRVAY